MTNDNDKELYAKTMLGDSPWDVQQPAESERPASQGAGDFTIEGYRLNKLLGRGGMGEVFLADRISSAGVNVPCAVKTILQNPADGEIDLHEMLLDEARLCSHLRHPNIVSIMDVGHAQDRLYIAMEWIEGIDAEGLTQLSKKRNKNIPFKHVLYILREALKGLHHAHTAVGPDGNKLGIVHRDISPDNILISRQGAVKLADFGVALGKTAQNAASQGMSAGKPAYKAPELWKGEAASIQSDIFSMGATLFELMTSKRLFELEDNFFVLMRKIIEFDVHKLVEEDLTLPDGIEDILINSLATEPGDRYESALQFLEDVNDFCYETGMRLLDAHFSTYIGRMLEYRAQINAAKAGG